MSNPALFRALRANRLDHVAPRSHGDAAPLFAGEVLTRQVVNHSAGEYHFSDKSKREEGGKDKGEQGEEEESDSRQGQRRRRRRQEE